MRDVPKISCSQNFEVNVVVFLIFVCFFCISYFPGETSLVLSFRVSGGWQIEANRGNQNENHGHSQFPHSHG